MMSSWSESLGIVHGPGGRASGHELANPTLRAAAILGRAAEDRSSRGRRVAKDVDVASFGEPLGLSRLDDKEQEQ